jgi:C-terminal processing protease CtpA/Prc
VDGERWLADGVAYLALHELPDDPGSVARVDRFLRDHADARALVLDLRTCRGGGPPIMNVLLPYLFARRTSLVYFEMSARIAEQLGPPPDEGPSFPTVPAPPGLVRRAHVAIPHPSEHRLFDAAVYLLVSRRTASAGEHLALALKRTRRAVLVGERTAGANHFGGMEPIGAGLAVFLPVGRTIDPDTGRDWERVGIQPDLAVPPDQALEAALMHMRRSAR